MVRTIVQGSSQVDHGITGQGALQNSFLDTLFNSGVEVLGNSATNNSYVEDQLVLLFLGLETDPDITELAAAAGLQIGRASCRERV